jgi:hypothetical protein
MSQIKRLINRLAGLIRKRKADDFFLTDLVISKEDEAAYVEWAKRKNERVLQKYRAKWKS